MIHLQKENVEAIGYQAAKEGKSCCGDSYYFTATNDYFLCVLADGLGSGQYAYEASSAVTAVVENNSDDDVEALMRHCNTALLQKRGAAVAVLKVDFKNREFIYSCVGNIRFYLYMPSGKMTYPLPVTGYLSGRPQVFRTQRFAYEPGTKFLLHSDGLKPWNPKALLKNCHNVDIVASEIQKQLNSKEDDSTFIIGSLQ